MFDFTSNVSDEDMENAKANRDSALNPPEVEPGMEDDFGWDDEGDLFGTEFKSEGFGGDSFSDGGFSSDFSDFGSFGDDFGGGGSFGGFGAPSQPPQEQAEDVFWDTIMKGGKGSFNFIKEIVSSFQDFETIRQKDMGRNTLLSGLGMVVLGLVLVLMGYSSLSVMIVSGFLVAGVGAPLFMISMEKLEDEVARGIGEVSLEKEEREPEDTGLGVDFGDFDDTEDIFAKIEVEEESEEDIFAGLFDMDEDLDFEVDLEKAEYGDFSVDLAETEEPEPEKKTVEEIQEVAENFNANMGMVTRSYLYETMMSVMEQETPDFNKVEELDENSREFLAFCSMIASSAEQIKTGKSEEMPQLIKAQDKLFYTQLEITRVKWMRNIQPFIDEIVNMCRYNPETGKVDENIVGYGHAVGGKVYVKILKGTTAMITVKDTYKQVEEYVLDTDNYMPVVFGVDEEGDVIVEDLKSINTMLVTGMPRSGKSWFMKTMLAQMMSFRGPEEVEFYLLDPKGAISDFKSMECMPHVKTFVSKDEEILRVLRRVTTVEADRRREIMSEAGGYIDFWDLKKEKPEIDLPLLYVVIDEVVTLSERMDNETKREFQSLLAQLVSQLPALGIRVFMVPHVVKHDIIKKTISDLIPCRISVCGDAGHIESTTGAKPSEFPYKLSNKGDMAVRLNNDKTKFSHGAVLATSNEAMDNHFEFLSSIWNKIQPPKEETKEEGAEKKPKQKKPKQKKQKRVDKKKEEKKESVDVSELLKDAHEDLELW